jgi:small-conductance mechanosensitive channel
MFLRAIQWIREWAIDQVPYRPLRTLIGLVVLLAGLAVLIFLVRLIFNWLDRKLSTWRGKRLREIRWQSQRLLSEDDISRIGRGIATIGRRLAYLVVFLLMLQIVFVLVPETEAFGRTTLGYVVAALSGALSGFIAFVPDLITIGVLYLIASYGVKLAKIVFNGIERGRIHITGFEREWAAVTYRIVRGAAWVLFAVVAFPYLPFANSPAFQGLSIFFGVLFSLGGSQTIGNVIAGIMLTYTNAFKVGDRVRIADAEGVIVAKTTHVTRIRTTKNVTISVPNSLVMSNHIINFTTMARDDAEGLIVHTTITIGYDVPYQQVEQLLLEAARATADVQEDPEPFVLQTALDDFYVAYQINVYTLESQQMPRILSDLHRNIQEKFHGAGVEIASPHLSALRDGNVANIPEDGLPKDYQPTSFRVLPVGNWGTPSANPGRGSDPEGSDR